MLKRRPHANRLRLPSKTGSKLCCCSLTDNRLRRAQRVIRLGEPAKDGERWLDRALRKLAPLIMPNHLLPAHEHWLVLHRCKRYTSKNGRRTDRSLGDLHDRERGEWIRHTHQVLRVHKRRSDNNIIVALPTDQELCYSYDHAGCSDGGCCCGV